MTQPKFIQISTLTSYPAALLNRDDSGLAKRIRFGGHMRTRISSQCLKRHWRLAEDEFALKNVAPDIHNSCRSRALFRLRIAQPLLDEGFGPEVVTAILTAFQKDFFKQSDKAKTREKKGDQNKSPLDRREVIVLGEPEIEFLIAQARELCQQAQGKEKEAKKLAEGFLKRHSKDMHALKYGAGVDGALFGRFVSGDPEARVSAAVHVAHSLTVHPESSETDYFTAVDDLLTGTEGGSAYLAPAELTSGLYYTYAVIDVPQLVSNLTGAPRENWLEEDRTVAARVVRHLVHLMAKVTPGAKLGSTAPYDYAGLVLVEAGARQPRTLANAFLEPVSLGEPDLFGRTIEALAGYLSSMDAMYGPGEQRWGACIRADLTLPGVEMTSLPEAALAAEAAVLSAGEAS